MHAKIQAILFDLDGTLLDNDMDVFLPAYFELIAARVADIMPAQEFIGRLMKATQKMLLNDGRETNEEVFAAAFYPLIGRARTEMEPIFGAFYAEDFPVLEQYTRCRAAARQVVETAAGLGYRLAVTTNPLFPATAIQQRLNWAGVGDFPWALVTSYENSRACKPNPVFFQQVLEYLDAPPEAALVVGDDPVDMAAAEIGCATFLMDGQNAVLVPAPSAPTYRGSLSDLEALLRRWG